VNGLNKHLRRFVWGTVMIAVVSGVAAAGYTLLVWIGDVARDPVGRYWLVAGLLFVLAYVLGVVGEISARSSPVARYRSYCWYHRDCQAEVHSAHCPANPHWNAKSDPECPGCGRTYDHEAGCPALRSGGFGGGSSVPPNPSSYPPDR
jgi:hypothetical protein